MSNNVNLENKYTNIVSNDYKHISTSTTFILLILPITNITNIIAIKPSHQQLAHPEAETRWRQSARQCSFSSSSRLWLRLLVSHRWEDKAVQMVRLGRDRIWLTMF